MRNILFKRPRVFVSYDRQEASIHAKTVSRRLGHYGVDVYYAPESLSPKTNSDLVKKQITRRDNFIVLLTSDFLNSEWGPLEIASALTSQRHIIPVEVDGFSLKDGDLPERIANLKQSRPVVKWNSQYPSVREIVSLLQPPVWLWLLNLVAVVSLFIGGVSLAAFLAYSILEDGDETLPQPTDAVIMGPSLTPSATLNPTEGIAATAVAIVTSTAYVEDVQEQVIAIYTQNAATNAAFESGTATALSVGDGSSSGGEVVGETVTPGPTLTPSMTPDVLETAVVMVDARNTATMETWLTLAVPSETAPSQTASPRRVTLTPTATVLPPSPLPPNNQHPEVTRGSSSSIGNPPTWTPSPTVTTSLTPSATPSPTASVTATPTLVYTPTSSPTAPTLPPTSAYFGLPTPAIMSNPSFVVIPVYAGPSESSGIVAFLNHADAVYIYAGLEDQGWVFIGFGWVRFDRVLPVGKEEDIPLFQTQVYVFAPAPTTEDDFRALGYQMMTLNAGDGGVTGRNDEPNLTFTPTPTPRLNLNQYQTFVAGETLTAMPTRTPSPMPSATRTLPPSRTPSPTVTRTATMTRTITPTATRTSNPTFTRTPTTIVPPPAGAMETFNPARYGCVTSSQTINVRAEPSTSATIVGSYASGSVVTVNGQQSGWYWIGSGWIFGDLMVVFSTQGEANTRCNSVPEPPPPDPNNPPPPPPPDDEPFSIEIINLNIGVYGELFNNEGQPQGCKVYFTVRLRGVASIQAEVYADNNYYQGYGNLEQVTTLILGDNPLSVTFGGAQDDRNHTINIVTSMGNASAGGRCRDS